MYGICAWRCSWALPGRCVEASQPGCSLWLARSTVPYDVRVALDMLCTSCDELLFLRDAGDSEGVFP